MAATAFRSWIPALALLVAASPLMGAPADAIRSRIANFRELGAAYKAVNDSLRGGEVQTVLLAQSARQIRNAARGQYAWFPAGSGPQAGVKTAAKPEIWANQAKFKSAQDAFAAAADQFQKVVASGDAAAIRTQARKLGATCKGCHDSFRTEAD